MVLPTNIKVVATQWTGKWPLEGITEQAWHDAYKIPENWVCDKMQDIVKISVRILAIMQLHCALLVPLSTRLIIPSVLRAAQKKMTDTCTQPIQNLDTTWIWQVQNFETTHIQVQH